MRSNVGHVVYHSCFQGSDHTATGEKNAKSKEMIRAKAAEYMERAEKLKNHLAEQDSGNKKKPNAMGANGKASNGGGKGKYVTFWKDSDPYGQTADEVFSGPVKTTMIRIPSLRNFVAH